MFILVKSYIQSPNFESDRYFPSKAANYAFFQRKQYKCMLLLKTDSLDVVPEFLLVKQPRYMSHCTMIAPQTW